MNTNQPDELKKAIEHSYTYDNVVSEQGKSGILWTLFEGIPFSSRRVASFETEQDARNFIELCLHHHSAAQRLQQVEKENRELKEQRLLDDGNISRMQDAGVRAEVERDQLKAALRVAEEALKPMTFFCKDYLKTVTHPGVSRLVGDADDALSTIQAVLKENR